MNVCVFCSAVDLDEKYTRPAGEFARLLGERGHNLVWGGSDTGLMKIMASGVHDAGGKIYGISTERHRRVARKDADEMIIAKDLGERKAMMVKRSDVLVMMVGGLGTIDEVTEVLVHKKYGTHDKPVLIFSIHKFYEGLKMQLQRMDAEGFLPRPLDELAGFADTAEEAIGYIERVRP